MLKVSNDHERKVTTPGSPVTQKRNSRNPRHNASLLQQSYFPLLVATTLTSALFAYLYITSSPVPVESIESLRQAITQGSDTADAPVDGTTEEHWLPTGGTLPTTASGRPAPGHQVDPTTKLVDANAPTVTQDGFFEDTNQLVQYEMVADLGNGKLQQISAELPAKYQSRMLRVSPKHRKHAEYIYARLNQLNKDMGSMQRESETLLRQWNQLVVESSPYEVLRPDSPTLNNASSGVLPPSRISADAPLTPMTLPNQPTAEPSAGTPQPAPTEAAVVPVPVKRPKPASITPPPTPGANEVIVTF